MEIKADEISKIIREQIEEYQGRRRNQRDRQRDFGGRWYRARLWS